MEYLKSKESIEKIAKEIFGPDRVMVIEDFLNDEGDEDRRQLSIYIHFPHIIIKNSKGHEHNIKDLFTRFTLSEFNSSDGDYQFELDFEGRRTTYSLMEMQCGYAHSHLPGGSYSFHEFCLGSSEFGLLFPVLRLAPTEDNWYMLLFSLENYLSWESLEGGPHFCMKDIRYSTSIRSERIEEELKRLIPLLPPEVWSFSEDLSLVSDHPLLEECFNTHSTIRTLNTISIEEGKRLVGVYEARHTGLVFNQTTIPFIVREEPLVEGAQIRGEVIMAYKNLLTEKVKEYSQNLGYEQSKRLYKERVFIPAGII